MNEENRTQTTFTQHLSGSKTEPEPVLDGAAVELGARLRAAREGRHLTLDDLGARLKVSTTKLRALEEGRLGALPDLTFARSLARACAKTLDIDISELLTQIAMPVQMGLHNVLANHTSGIEDATFGENLMLHRASKPLRWGLLLVVLAGVTVLFLVGLDRARHWIARSNKTLEMASTPPVSSSASNAASASPPALMPAPTTSIVALPSFNVASTPSAQRVVSEPILSTASTPIAVANNTSAGPASVATVLPVTASMGEAIIRLSGDSWIEVRDAKGAMLHSGLVKAGNTLSLRGTPPLSVVLGNVAGTQSIEFAGAPVDLSRVTNGNVARFKLPQ
jgi:cytoskeleton protein RodZ